MASTTTTASSEAAASRRVFVPRKDDLKEMKETFLALCKKRSAKKRCADLSLAQCKVLRVKLTEMVESVFEKVAARCRFGCEEDWEFEDGESSAFAIGGTERKAEEVMEPLDRKLAHSVSVAEGELAELVKDVLRYREELPKGIAIERSVGVDEVLRATEEEENVARSRVAAQAEAERSSGASAVEKVMAQPALAKLESSLVRVASTAAALRRRLPAAASQSRATLSAVAAHESAPPSAVEKILADKASVANAQRGNAVAAAVAAAGVGGATGAGPGKAGKGRAVAAAAARRRFVGLVVGAGEGTRSHPYRRPAGK